MIADSVELHFKASWTKKQPTTRKLAKMIADLHFNVETYSNGGQEGLQR